MLKDIYDRWIADAALQAAVPTSRVCVGWFLEEPSQFPYAAIEDAGNAAGQYTSSSNVFENRFVRFHVFHTDLDTLIGTIAPAIRAEFNRVAFAASRGDVVNLQWQNDSMMYLPDGTYHLISNYLATVNVGVGV